MITIPELVSLPHDGKPKAATRGLRKAWPLKYSKAYLRDKRVCLYVSDTPMIARSELWRDVLDARQVDLEYTVVLEVISNSKALKQLYCVVIEEGTVTSHWLQSSFNVTNHVAVLMAKTVLCVCPQEEDAFYGQWCEPLSENELETASLYALHAKKPRWPWVLGGAVVALGVTAAVMWPEPQKEPVVIDTTSGSSVVIDPWAEYHAIMNEGFAATSVLKQVQNVMVTARLLPPKWKAVQIQVKRGIVTLDIEREPLGQMQMFEQWLELYPALKPYVQFDREGAQLSTPVEKTLEGWADRIIPMQPTQSTLLDALASVGFDALNVQERSGVYQHTGFSLNKPLSLFDVEVLLTLMAPLPMTIGDFSLSPAGEEAWQGEMHLSLYGVGS